MVTIAVDAMGGDHAPRTEVEGAIRAAKSLDVKVILVGREDALREELSRHDGARFLPIQIVHASERVTMEDSAAKAVRGKRDSSIRVASRLVRDVSHQACPNSPDKTAPTTATEWRRTISASLRLPGNRPRASGA